MWEEEEASGLHAQLHTHTARLSGSLHSSQHQLSSEFVRARRQGNHSQHLHRTHRHQVQIETLMRGMAFARVYAEGRWANGADRAACLSGWSDVRRGQATEAVRVLAEVVQTYGIRSYTDLPVGDGCFSSSALATLPGASGPSRTSGWTSSRI